MRNFVTDKQGGIIGLTIMIVTTILVAILFITTMPAAGVIWQSVIPMFPNGTPPSVQQTMNLLNVVSGVTLLILVGGTILYGLADATRRDPYDVPA
jgi:hypothetical protein